MQDNKLHKLGAEQNKRPRIVIDTNKHGIRRETNLDKQYKKKIKTK